MSWIKIHTKLLQWEWHDCPETLSLWIHILMRANYKDMKWHGEVVERGSFITSLGRLAEDVGASFQQIRTGLQRLQATGEIEVKSTNRYTKITVCKYDTYQCDDSLCNKQITNKQQSNNNQITTSIEYKNTNIEKEDISKDISKKESSEALMSSAKRVYDAYPAKDPVSSRRTYKSTKDIDKIIKLLKGGLTEEKLLNTIRQYVSESTGYMQNFQTFLNHLPDYSDIEQPTTKTTTDKYSNFQC